MSTLHTRAQRTWFLLVTGILCFTLAAPIAAMAQEDATADDTAGVSTEEAAPEESSSDEPVAAEEPVSSTIPWKEPIDYGVVVDNSAAPLPGDGLACRVDAYSSAEVLVRIWPGESVEVTGQSVWVEGIEFLPINCAGQGGFVKADYIALNSEAAVEEPVVEEPAVEEPAAEEPAAEESFADESGGSEQAAVEPPAQDAPVAGDLIVTVLDQNGQPVAGVCFDLYDANGWVANACDASDAVPNNGNNGFFGLPEGGYTLVASDAPGGIAIPNQEAWVTAGGTAYATVSVSVAAVEEPAAPEEEVVTEEVTEEVVTEEVVTEVPATEEVVTEEVTEVPATEEITEEPATEEVTEAPVTEEVTEAPVTEEVTEAPVTEEPATEEAAETPATEEVATEEAPAGPDLSKAIGDATVTGTNGEGVRCRVAPSPDAATITVIPEGATVFVLEAPANGYIGVVCGNQLGYADVNYMWAGGAGDEIPASASSVVVVGTGGMSLNCRTAPNGSVITAVPMGTVLTSRGASSNGWAPVVCGGQNGFVSIAFVEATSSSPSTGSTTNNQVTTTSTGTGTVTGTDGDGVRCRTSAGGSVIMVVPEGTVLTTRGAASNGWVPVVCGGQNGFVSADYFTVGSGTGTGTTDPGTGTGTTIPSSGYVKVTGTGGASLNCRTAASMSGMVITAVPYGSTVAVRGATTNGWVPVTCGGKSGYVSASYVTATTSGGSNPGGGTTDPGTGATGTAVVSNTGGDGLRCRTTPGGTQITVVAEGTTVTTRGASSNGWTPVVCGGQNGYMSSQYLTASGGGTTNPTPTPTPDPGTGSGTGMGNGDHGKVSVRANMRYSASTSANVVVIVDAGEVLLITGNATNGFYPVDYDGLKGFMSTSLLTKTSEALSERGGSGTNPDPDPGPGGGGSASGSAIVSYAMRYVGYPYVWATHGPSSFDCSGFTYWVTKNVLGMSIGTGLWTQVSAGTPVSRSNLQPGDIVFFQNTYKAGLSHVGIYIGNNQFVHAENENTGVRVSDLNSTYYGSRWYGAVRLA